MFFFLNFFLVFEPKNMFYHVSRSKCSGVQKPLINFRKLFTNRGETRKKIKHGVIRYFIFHFAEEQRRPIARAPDQNAVIIGEVLAIWLRTKALELKVGRGGAEREIEKKSVEHRCFFSS